MCAVNIETHLSGSFTSSEIWEKTYIKLNYLSKDFDRLCLKSSTGWLGGRLLEIKLAADAPSDPRCRGKSVTSAKKARRKAEVLLVSPRWKTFQFLLLTRTDSHNISVASMNPCLPLTFPAVSMWEVPGEILFLCLCFEQSGCAKQPCKNKNMINFLFHADLNFLYSLLWLYGSWVFCWFFFLSLVWVFFVWLFLGFLVFLILFFFKGQNIFTHMFWYICC